MICQWFVHFNILCRFRFFVYSGARIIRTKFLSELLVFVQTPMYSTSTFFRNWWVNCKFEHKNRKWIAIYVTLRCNVTSHTWRRHGDTNNPWLRIYSIFIRVFLKWNPNKLSAWQKTEFCLISEFVISEIGINSTKMCFKWSIFLKSGIQK